jgi:iron uptake system component EfeO
LKLSGSVAIAGLVGVALAVAGCGAAKKEKAEGRVVSVRLIDAGCDPAQLTLAAGPVTLEVENDGAEAVSELEVLDGDRILGEVENLTPGLSGRFSLTLEPGRYTTYCPGGTTAERGVLTVTGRVSSQAPEQAAAVARYRSYVERQTALLRNRTRAFVASLGAGDLPAAKLGYAAARIPYERIEPVAESFGGLDPAIDARAGDVPTASWTGFHPLEQTLWVKGRPPAPARSRGASSKT